MIKPLNFTINITVFIDFIIIFPRYYKKNEIGPEAGPEFFILSGGARGKILEVILIGTELEGVCLLIKPKRPGLICRAENRGRRPD
jgi:hypothetical protein